MTPFSEITPLIYDELEKSELFEDNYLDTEIKLNKISRIILKGATVDFTTCKKDLNDYLAYSEYKKQEIIKIETNSLVFDIFDIDEKLRNEIILYVNDVEIINFTYKIKESETNVGEYCCCIDYEFKVGDKVEIIFINEGYFNEDLSFREKYIIALASAYHYMDSKIKEEQKWYKKLGDKDYTLTRDTLSNYIALNKSIKENLVIYIQKYNEQTASVDDFM
ncbi:TPA: hypothetical protein LA460_000234 [Clostridium botulinum]|nr:hypothetical protein [Clostridium botulinum]HBJ1652838.1 hypothetical protein [Clostridium botulinum]